MVSDRSDPCMAANADQPSSVDHTGSEGNTSRLATFSPAPESTKIISLNLMYPLSKSRCAL